MKGLQALAIGVAIASLTFIESAIAQSPKPQPASRLDCLVGYPDGNFRGDRALTRYEFAAGMLACLDRTVQKIEATKGGLATKTELDVIRQQYEQMTQEVRQLNQRVYLLED